ncbi:MAG: transcription elongation factor GreA [Prevotellaceae bacterium]|jgi:transcription elongation factor GreA|nr:transcription elongation factor GreA [Prevotellaceae bacterium]
MATAHYITEEGLQRLRAELAQLKNVERPAVSRLIAEARDKGDLSENAEYDAAKEMQGLLEMKISALENKVANARIIDETRIDLSQVQILTKVKIKNVATKAVMEYTLVTETEANIKEGKLAVGTPIAQALLGRKKGEIIDVKVPSGIIKLQILSISKG